MEEKYLLCKIKVETIEHFKIEGQLIISEKEKKKFFIQASNYYEKTVVFILPQEKKMKL